MTEMPIWLPCDFWKLLSLPETHLLIYEAGLEKLLGYLGTLDEKKSEI